MLQANDLASVAFPNATAWLLLEGALEGAAVLAVGAVCVLVSRAASAAVRHMIWTLTLAGACVAPVAGAFLPQWRVAIPGWAGLPASGDDAPDHGPVLLASLPVEQPFDGPLMSSGSATATEPSAVTESNSVSGGSWSADMNPVVAAFVAGEPTLAVETVPSSEPGLTALAEANGASALMPSAERLATISRIAMEGLAATWLIGVVLTLIPTAVGMARVSALVRRARPMHGGRWALLAPSAMREIDVRRRVRFLELDEPVMPMTSGVFRPVVLLPAGDFDSTIAQRLDVLRHELAHVRRHDCLTQVVAQLACALNWFNPLVWLAAREMRVERERACDDEVLRAGAKASAYADYLMRVARETRMGAVAAFGALAMARPSQLAVRLRALLDDERCRERVSRSKAVAATVAAACLVAAVGTATPSPAEARVVEVVPQALAPAIAEVRSPTPATSLDAPLVAVVAEVPVAASPSLAAISTLNGQAASVLVSDVWPSAVAPIAAGTVADCDRNARTRGKSSHSSSISSNDGDKRWRVVWSEGDCSYEVDARGEIRFNRDVTDLESISNGGHFTIEQHDGDDTKRLRIRPRADGTLERAYWVNGEAHAFDDAARAWFAEALLAIERRTAFAVDQRVPAILQSGGVDAVLREISLLYADYARRRYYTKLLSMRQLDQPQVRRVVEQAGAEISSDYELAELLVAVSKLDAFGDDSHAAFVGAVKKIDSDYECRRALNALLKRDRLAPATVESLLGAASTIESDYELAELLIDVSRQYAINEQTRPVYIKAVGSIQSDYEHRRVLSAIVAGGGLTPTVTRALLEDARRIASDYELAEFLVTISRKGVLDASTRDAYFAAADKIKSDYEHRRALTPLLQRDLLTKDIAKGILASTAKIDSDYEAAELLVGLASAITIDQDLRPAFDKAADTIKGEYEYGRAMNAARRSATR